MAVDVNPAPNGRLSIPITAIGEGGAHGGDFTISSATLTFNSGQTAKNVTVTAVDDAVDDDGESVTLDFGELPAGVTAGRRGDSVAGRQRRARGDRVEDSVDDDGR